MNFQYPNGVHAPVLHKPRMVATPHQYGWRDSARLRQGMLWRGSRVRLADYPGAPKYILLMLLITILIMLASAVDYASQTEVLVAEERAKTTAQAAHAESLANMLGRCIEGELKLTHDNDTGKGYSKTAIVCKKAEQFDI